MISEKKKYFTWLKKELQAFCETRPQVKAFIFGSSLKKDKFGDIDIGLQGKVADQDVRWLKEHFANSTFPYFVDIINFNMVKQSFAKNVFAGKVLWIRP